MANIIIVGVRIPFVRGGQDVLVASLERELVKRGHVVDTIELPFSVLPKDRLLREAALWRSLNLTEFSGKKVDLVIATKFPSYYVKHPRKSVWLVHQHREMYDLFGSRFSDFSDDPRDEELRRFLVEGDQKVLQEAGYLSGISRNVVERLKQYNGLAAEPLYPPLPLAGQYRSHTAEDYILSVGRLCAIKRTDLAIKSMPGVNLGIKLKIAGTPETPEILEYYKNEMAKHHLQNRVELLGRVSDEQLVDLYARSLGVIYVPHNEDYGYVTLEAMASGKPVVTCTDSGGVLEFVRHEENGLIVDPNPDSVAAAINRFAADRATAARFGATGRQLIEENGLGSQGWDHVIGRLLSPLDR